MLSFTPVPYLHCQVTSTMKSWYIVFFSETIYSQKIPHSCTLGWDMGWHLGVKNCNITGFLVKLYAVIWCTAETALQQAVAVIDLKVKPQWPGGCFTNVSRALQNNLAKIHNTGNQIYVENFKLKLCTCVQSMALGTGTKFQLEILITSTISTIHTFRENILESSRNVSETPPWLLAFQWITMSPQI